jgi:hypothetical protein
VLPHDLHAPVNRSAPEPPGICDRCGRKWPLSKLVYQFDWRGNALANLRLRVCPDDLDKPFEFNRPLRIPPDPVPVQDPRPYQYAVQMAGNGLTLPTTVTFNQTTGPGTVIEPDGSAQLEII